MLYTNPTSHKHLPIHEGTERYLGKRYLREIFKGGRYFIRDAPADTSQNKSAKNIFAISNFCGVK